MCGLNTLEREAGFMSLQKKDISTSQCFKGVQSNDLSNMPSYDPVGVISHAGAILS